MHKIIQLIKSKFYFFLAFILSKGIVFFAPLFLADILSKEEFGVIEYALAGLGMVLNTMLGLGVQSAYPYFKLREKNSSLNNAFGLHYVWLLLFFLSTQVVYYFVGFALQYYIALNVAYVVSNQVYISTQLKTNERIIPAVLLDSGVYISLLIFGFLAYFNLLPSSIVTFSYIVLIYSIFYVFYAIIQFKAVDKIDIIDNYIIVLKYSLHVVLGGLLIYFLTVSGRLLIEYFLKDFELVAIYAFYFRLSAVIVMIYQIINIAFFKKMYEVEPKILDKYFSICFAVLYGTAVLCFLVSSLVLPHFSSFYITTIAVYKPVYYLLSAQMVFWIATALLSNIIDREKLASKNNPLFLILVLIYIGTLFFIKTNLNLEIFTFIHLSVIALASLIQIFTLRKKNIFFKYSFFVLIAVFITNLITFKFFFN